MELVKIICDKCNFSTQKDLSRYTAKTLKAMCPNCRHIIVIDRSDSPEYPTLPEPILPTDLPIEKPVKKEFLERPVETDREKIIAGIFAILIALFVCVKIWASSRFASVPVPNLLAVSQDRVAVQAGTMIYVYSKEGALLSTHQLGDKMIPSQLFWDNNVLCVSDTESQSVVYPGKQDLKPISFKAEEIGGPFRVVREPSTKRLFVSESGKHRILMYTTEGIFIKQFGTSGKEKGSLNKPGDMHFDEDGHLLVSNTRHPSIDMYTSYGKFEKEVVVPSGDPVFRYPTSFAMTRDRFFVLENDERLQSGKIRIYDRNGQKIADLNMGNIDVAGIIAVDGERLYLTDSKSRGLETYSLSGLAPLGPFCADFESRCQKWRSDAVFYNRLSNGILVFMLLIVVTAYILYKKYRFKDEPIYNLKS